MAVTPRPPTRYRHWPFGCCIKGYGWKLPTIDAHPANRA